MFSFSCTKERKKEVPFSMAIGNGELMHECFPKHWMKKEWNKNEKRQWDRRRMNKEERRLDSLSLPNQNTILINTKYYFKRYGKNNKIQLTKKQNRLKIEKWQIIQPPPPGHTNLFAPFPPTVINFHIFFFWANLAHSFLFNITDRSTCIEKGFQPK